MIPEALSESVRLALVRGRYSLLLGAGFSASSTASTGENLPIGSMFATELSQKFGLPAGYSLSQLASAIPAATLSAFITNRFSGCKASPAASKIASFVWRHIFTLNVDDVLHDAYRGPQSLQNPVWFTFHHSYVSVDVPVDVPIVHLHGSVQHSEHGYVFSAQQYGSVAGQDSTWFKIAADLILDQPFIILGCSLNEFDLEYYLARRSGISAETQPVAPSIFVTRKLDAVLAATCARFGLIPVESDSDQFIEYLDSLTRPRSTPAELTLPRESERLFRTRPPERAQIVFFRQWLQVDPASLPSPIDNVRDLPLLRGTEPNWLQIERNDDVTRADAKRLVERITKWWSSAEAASVVDLTFSPPGEGKSVVLIRSCLELARSGVNVFYFSGQERLSVNETVEVLSRFAGPVVLAVDSVAEHVHQLAELVRRLSNSTTPLRFFVVGAERTGRSNRVGSGMFEVPFSYQSLSRLSKAEALSLVAKMRELGLLRQYVRRTNEELAARFEKQELFSAVLTLWGEAAHASQVISTEWSELSIDAARPVYSAVAVAHALGYPIRLAVIARATGIQVHQIRHLISNELKGTVVPADMSGESYQTRHRRLAELLLQSLPPTERFDRLVGLAKALAPYVNRLTIRRRTTEARLAGRLLDFDDTIEHFLAAKAEQFYNDIHDEWAWNSRYWEQRALLELQREPLAALGLAQTAVGIEDHPLPLTTLGKVQLALAKKFGTVEDTRRFLKDGIQTLDRAIHRSQEMLRRDGYPFDVAIRGGLGALERLAKEEPPVAAEMFVVSRMEEYLEAAARLYREAEYSEFMARWSRLKAAGVIAH